MIFLENSAAVILTVARNNKNRLKIWKSNSPNNRIRKKNTLTFHIKSVGTTTNTPIRYLSDRHLP